MRPFEPGHSLGIPRSLWALPALRGSSTDCVGDIDRVDFHLVVVGCNCVRGIPPLSVSLEDPRRMRPALGLTQNT